MDTIQYTADEMSMKRLDSMTEAINIYISEITLLLYIALLTLPIVYSLVPPGYMGLSITLVSAVKGLVSYTTYIYSGTSL